MIIMWIATSPRRAASWARPDNRRRSPKSERGIGSPRQRHRRSHCELITARADEVDLPMPRRLPDRPLAHHRRVLAVAATTGSASHRYFKRGFFNGIHPLLRFKIAM